MIKPHEVVKNLIEESNQEKDLMAFVVRRFFPAIFEKEPFREYVLGIVDYRRRVFESEEFKKKWNDFFKVLDLVSAELLKMKELKKDFSKNTTEVLKVPHPFRFNHSLRLSSSPGKASRSGFYKLLEMRGDGGIFLNFEERDTLENRKQWLSRVGSYIRILGLLNCGDPDFVSRRAIDQKIRDLWELLDEFKVIFEPPNKCYYEYLALYQFYLSGKAEGIILEKPSNFENDISYFGFETSCLECGKYMRRILVDLKDYFEGSLDNEPRNYFEFSRNTDVELDRQIALRCLKEGKRRKYSFLVKRKNDSLFEVEIKLQPCFGWAVRYLYDIRKASNNSRSRGDLCEIEGSTAKRVGSLSNERKRAQDQLKKLSLPDVVITTTDSKWAINNSLSCMCLS